MSSKVVYGILVVSLASFTKGLTGPSHGKVVVCYLGTWSIYRPERGSFTIEHLDPNLCSHIIYSFAGLDVSTDSIKALDPWQDLTENYGKGGYKRLTDLKHRYRHLKVTLAIGGWNEGSKNYSELARNPSRRSKFVSNALDFIRKYKFDGLDLDWEFPGKRGGSPEDKTNFLLLVKELRSSFRKYNLLLTAAFGAGKDTMDVAYDIEGLSVYLDYIHTMCYDYHGAWDLRTGANAPLRSQDSLNVQYSIEYLLKNGAPANKLVLGIPFYGRTFITENAYRLDDNPKKPKLGAVAKNLGFQGPFTRESGFMGYNEICLELRNNSSWSHFWDSESETPYAVLEDKVIAYDNVKSIKKKVHFAMEKKLAGVMVWSVDTDDFQGDCAENSAEGLFHNFPLLRGINKDIDDILEEMKRDEENAIIHGKAERTSAATTTITLVSKTVLALNIILLAFNYIPNM